MNLYFYQLNGSLSFSILNTNSNPFNVDDIIDIKQYINTYVDKKIKIHKIDKFIVIDRETTINIHLYFTEVN